MIAPNYNYVDDEQELYTLEEARHELAKRAKAKRETKAYKKRLLKQRLIALFLLGVIVTIGLLYQAWAYMTLFCPFFIYLLCEEKIILNV